MTLTDEYVGLRQDEADERAEYAHPSAEVRMWTKELTLWGYSGDFRNLKFSGKRVGAGAMTIEFPDDDYYREYFAGQHRNAMRPISIHLPGYRTLWLTVDFKRIRKGLKRFWQVVAVDPKEYLNWMHLWPCPWLPPEFQPIKFWFGFGGGASVNALAMTANLVRLQGELFTIPTGNLFELDTWNIVRKALWPLMVNPRRKFLNDPTKITATSWRMDKMMDAFNEVNAECDLQTTYQFYIHGEDEQPFPEFGHLDRNQIIFDFVEKGAPVSFNANIIDGFVRTGLQLADDALQWIAYPILNKDNYNDYLQKAAGLIPGKPLALYTTGEYSPIQGYEQSYHVATASRVTAGGKSPEWLNELMVTGANLAVGALGTALGAPGLQIGIFGSLLKNTIMAFHSAEDRMRAIAGGPLRFRETFAESSTTGLSLNTFAGMKKTLFDNRDFVGNSIEVSNGAPYFVGKDLNEGDPIAVELPDGSADVDYLEQIDYDQPRAGVPGKFVLNIGSPDSERDPGSIALGKFRKAATWVNRLALSE